MSKKIHIKAILAGSVFTFISAFSHATVVEIKTSLGPIKVNLFDNTTPQTVANFLNYVQSGAYVNNVVHRVKPNFVVQAGGFNYSGNFPKLDTVPPRAPVINEPKLSNLRGTIAMAKLGGKPSSATSQWYINLSDNNVSSLDPNAQGSGGYTVFGQVLGNGMQVIDAIAALKTFNAGGALSDLPLRNYTSADATNNVAITSDNLVLISDIVVIDAAVVTHPEIVPTVNTLINKPNSGSDSGSGGGSFAWLSLLALIGLGRRLYRS
ncbi:peptidylprolyl isomerase [Paraglaciecola sp.]|uniref:peptidylprolyl isomerase n=1 Tax=Paraglaciecola sp. TaxID=1920173 RepID=UPI0030F47B0A